MERNGTKESKIRLGIISALWLPKFGGAEQYLYRMANGLIAEGLDVRVFCGTGQKVGFDNGQISATRFVPKGNIEIESWKPSFSERTPEYLRVIANHFAWFNEAVSWCKKNGIDVVLICNPFQQVHYFHGHELFSRLRDAGIKVGLVHHDLPKPIENFLQQIYLAGDKSWAETANHTQAELSKALHAKPGLEGYLEIGSPLAFSPDFIISNSEWVYRFIDPLKANKNFIFHGPVDAEYLRQSLGESDQLPSKDVLMINPQNRKGPAEMRDLIHNGDNTWSYRVLKGGWGDSLKTFKPLVKGTKAFAENRIEFVDYVKDMRSVYRSAGVSFFPSHYEGYGLAAVEPMFVGTPVVSSNYPAIVEAVGEGAKTLCPYRNSASEWRDAVAQVLDNRQYWSDKAVERAEVHSARQAQQTFDLAHFLKKQALK